MLQEFKKFAIRGNVIDLAVGVIVGGAFGRITTSLVTDIIMPPLGLLLGKVDFGNLYVSLLGERYPSLAAAKEAGVPTVNYGLFLNTVVEFFIVSFVIFLVVRQINRLRPPVPATTKECPFCRLQIPLKAVRCPQCTSRLETRKPH